MLKDWEIRRIFGESHVPESKWRGKDRSERNAEILLALARGIDELESADEESLRRRDRAIEALIAGAQALRGELHENAGRRWSEQDIGRLTEALGAGMSLAETAKMLGRSERAVWMKMEELNPSQKEPGERREALEAAWWRLRNER